MKRGKDGFAPLHTLLEGDAMKEKKKSYNITFIQVGDRSDEIVKALAKREIEKVLEKHGAVSYNLDEILCKYISEEMRNEHKK